MKILAGLLMIFSLVGCMATISGLPISQQNIEKLRANAIILVKTGPLQVAYLKAAMGNDLQKLPSEAVEALDEITAICAKPELSDEDLGAISGLWDRFLILCSPQALQQIMVVLGQIR